jgi:hypothetical protein
LQQLLESGQFELALSALDSFSQLMLENASAARSATEQRQMLQDAQMFLEERLHLARVMRAQLASQVATTNRLIGYQDVATSESSWNLDG